MYPSYRTREAVESIGRAKARDLDEHPIEDTDLGQTRDEGSHHLDGEKQLGRDLHIVAEFEVRGELDALSRTDIAVRHKHHVCDGTAWKDHTAD